MKQESDSIVMVFHSYSLSRRSWFGRWTLDPTDWNRFVGEGRSIPNGRRPRSTPSPVHKKDVCYLELEAQFSPSVLLSENRWIRGQTSPWIFSHHLRRMARLEENPSSALQLEGNHRSWCRCRVWWDSVVLLHPRSRSSNMCRAKLRPIKYHQWKSTGQ